MAGNLVTERLVLRPWTVDDAGAALVAYGDAEVARWLTPAMDRVPDLAAMRLVFQQWVAEAARMTAPAGRWAIERRSDGDIIGGATLLPLPPDEEYEMGWQLHRPAWGHGYATEAGLAIVRVPKTPSVQACSMFILVQYAAQAVTSVDVELCDLVWIGERLGQWMEWSGVRDASMGPVGVVMPLVLAQGV